MAVRKIVLYMMVASMLSTPAVAQTPITLQDAVKNAIVSNPEVQARWHAFQASLSEQDVARGGYLPRIDINAGISRESLTQPGLSTNNFTRRGAVLSLNQMVFDGFATRDEVARLGYTKLVRYYEVLDVSESIALEASRAFMDVLRYRELSRLAQENYAQHEQVFVQIQQRVQAGVGRRVDFEQAGGRLALAQSNMLTEASNLHDISARYLRIVGELPPGEMVAPALLKQGIPPSVEEALKLAYQGSPAFNAAIENVRASQAEASGRQSNFMPRVDLRARTDVARNDNGIPGQRDEHVIELVVNYNLFKGGSDQALVRQFAQRLNQSKDLRDKACRDIRQTISIAFNDIQNLSRQLSFLDQHQLSIEKAREAYRKQFDIGQRTLLDLLDTENEYFQARRAYVNATYEHAIAHVRALAGMGNLLSTLQVGRDGLPTARELGQDRFNVDAESQCPAVAPFIPTGHIGQMPRQIETAPVSTVKPAQMVMPMPSGAITRPAAPSGAISKIAAPAISPVPLSKPAPLPAESLSQSLNGWATAWAAKDDSRYKGYYAKSFSPNDSGDLSSRLNKSGAIKVEISDVKLSPPDASRTTTDFKQTYSRSGYRDVVIKRIEWVREDNRWKIRSEQVLTTLEAVYS